MTTVLIVIHLMVVLAMIGLVLLQRSEGGALGIGGGSGAFLTGRSAGNVLTRTTAVLALAFFLTSIGLTFLARMQSRPSDIFDTLSGTSAPANKPAQAPAPPVGGEPTSAQDVLKGISGGAPGPQTPPAGGTAPANGAATAPATPAAPAPATGTAPAPQAPPASGGGQ
jgi:preprotein translocase subunit SecG